MTEIFDTTTKLRFRDAADAQYIKFGRVSDKDPQYDIRSGQLKLAGQDVAKCFEPSVQAIAEAFEKQRTAAMTRMPIKHAFLVGGYAASEFLNRRLRTHPTFSNVHLCRPASHVNKAVADGAVSFYIDHLVTSRTSKFIYGIDCNYYYDSSLADHRERANTKFNDPSGQPRLPNGFGSILKKGIQVSEQQEFRRPFVFRGSSPSELTSVQVSVFAYRGSLLEPTWMDKEPGSFTKMCTVIADTSKFCNSLSPQISFPSNTYYSLDIEVILLFGLTELKAQISWNDKGVEMRSPASIVYDI